MSDRVAVEIGGATEPGSRGGFADSCGFRTLRALRRILRAVAIHSRRLCAEHGVTTPQMICLHALAAADAMTLTDLAREVDLGASTVNGIVDRMEAKGWVVRRRSREDRRKVFVALTPAGLALSRDAPSLLQDRFSQALGKLPELEQATIALALERVVELMDADDLDTSPHLIPHAGMDAPGGEPG